MCGAMAYVTIKKRKDFLSATSSGKKFVTGSFVLQMVKRSDDDVSKNAGDGADIRIGFTVTKKMGNAVIRNRIKRRLREAAKEAFSKYGKSGHDYVIISRHKAVHCPFSDLCRDMEFAFKKILTYTGKKNSGTFKKHKK